MSNLSRESLGMEPRRSKMKVQFSDDFVIFPRNLPEQPRQVNHQWSVGGLRNFAEWLRMTFREVLDDLYAHQRVNEHLCYLHLDRRGQAREQHNLPAPRLLRNRWPIETLCSGLSHRRHRVFCMFLSPT